MQLSWHGQYTIKIISKDTTLCIDPYAANMGIPPFRAKADILSLSNPQDASMSNISSIQGNPIVINTPGEYSLKEFALHSIGWNDEQGNERSLQRFMVEDIVVLHIGSLNRDLNASELQELERADIDVFFVPVGGGTALTLSQAMKMITTIEPKIVIPIHYALPKLTEKLESVESFAKEMGVSATATEKKLILKKNKLPQEDMQTVILAPY
ncbi:MAG: MBL fold metallo-hydrolase [bacterium]|nr:MBL fold metallo-hydrolase [bacterium]